MICVVLPYDTDFVLFSLDILILCICFVLILHHNDHHFCRVTTCLENLEMSGNLTAVREKILSGKSCLKLFIASCIFASIHLCLVLVRACRVPWRSAENRQGNVRESSGNFTLSGEWSPCTEHLSAIKRQVDYMRLASQKRVISSRDIQYCRLNVFAFGLRTLHAFL